jgi:hypothetical protein
MALYRPEKHLNWQVFSENILFLESLEKYEAFKQFLGEREKLVRI